MLSIVNGYERWLLTNVRGAAAVAFFNKMRSATLEFLLSRKLVTKSFLPLEIYGRDDGSYRFSEARRLYRILIVNTRKKYPTLRKSEVEYVYPFIQYNNRINSVTLNITGTDRSLRVVDRYLRYIKASPYLWEKGAQVSIITSNNFTAFTPEDTLGLIRVTRVTLVFLNHDNNSSISTYLAVFLIPDILKVVSTLHRKAMFTVDIDLNSSTAVSEYGNSGFDEDKSTLIEDGEESRDDPYDEVIF